MKKYVSARLPFRSPARAPGFAFSFSLHALVLAFALGAFRRQEPDAPRSEREAHLLDPTRQVQMVYLPLEPAPRPAVPPPGARPSREGPENLQVPEGQSTSVPEPRLNAPPEEARSVATAEREPESEGAIDSPEPLESGTQPVPAELAETPTMESEARKLFGQRSAPAGPPLGARDVRPFQALLPPRSAGCSAPPARSAGPDAPLQMGTVVGRIYRKDDGRPLAGAHLQILGTAYVAFTNDQGVYRLTFERSLVDNCRTQYVRVWAKGYETRLLVLAAGNLPSEDVLLQRH